MTQETMARMAETMRHFQQTKKVKILTEKWKEFLSETGEILEKLTDVITGEEDEDEEDYEEEAIVLYAEPNNSFHLVEEVEAIEEIMLNHSVSGFISHFITDELMAMYPKEYARARKDGSVLVIGPLYIAHPVIDEDELDACMDLSAVEFCEALAYLTSHTIYAKNNAEAIGFLLEKED